MGRAPDRSLGRKEGQRGGGRTSIMAQSVGKTGLMVLAVLVPVVVFLGVATSGGGINRASSAAVDGLDGRRLQTATYDFATQLEMTVCLTEDHNTDSVSSTPEQVCVGIVAAPMCSCTPSLLKTFHAFHIKIHPSFRLLMMTALHPRNKKPQSPREIIPRFSPRDPNENDDQFNTIRITIEVQQGNQRVSIHQRKGIRDFRAPAVSLMFDRLHYAQGR